MGGLVEEAVDRSVRSILLRDSTLTKDVIKNDHRIDDLENLIDQHCVGLLATYQPVAVDLRFLTAALRICTMLERTGDQAVNLAQRAQVLNELEPIGEIPGTFQEMTRVAMEMTRKCLDAFVQGDLLVSYAVCKQDDELDDLNRRLLEEMINWMMGERRLIRRGVEIILAGRHLERIGDQATNISEEVVFMVEGSVIRHQGCEL